ncbi:hypothetical protein VCHA37P200_20624 [Vibrio chagasii]|nr:hypothetical protein VCHA36P161_20620 [Vibrio chagasii]CAH7039097.1 hypothetical protein VCHA50O396_170018 [Vibrio chagasii]CAH7083510.1 hypothetical protein VCHA55P509_10606 [Vibrio chagasii]CAH7100622.1 hypothetical protein VCHA53O473_10020 [Vibrio chagasii]CAH7101448.1 hypothetical protein VCHA54O485_10605 [Vibrio chagasii]
MIAPIIAVDFAKKRTSFITEGFTNVLLLSFVITVAFIVRSRCCVIYG